MNLNINSNEAAEPIGAYPHAKQFGDLLFLSGIGPREKNSKEIPGVEFHEDGSIKSHDIVAQTHSVVRNIKNVLKSCGASLEDILDIQVFLTDMKNDFAKFNQVYAHYFKEIAPTRTTIEVLSLPTPIAVEFKVIAKAPK